MATMKRTYGQSLAYFRNLKGKSAQEIAETLGISVVEVIAHENDVLVPTLDRHCDYCNVINICSYEPFEDCFGMKSA